MNKKEKVIGIFTTFWDFDAAYSLTSIVRDQLKSFVKHGYKTVLFVLPTFKDDALVPEGVEIRKVIPQLILETYKGLQYPEYWKEDVAKARKFIEQNAQDITDMICHDIFFIDTYLPYNCALREANLSCNILAWTHSAPSSRPSLENNPHANRFNLPPRTKLIYLNHQDCIALAEMYGAWLKDIRVVHNPKDPRSFWNLDPLVIDLIDKYKLLEKDIISIYPLSTPRMGATGKRIESVIKIHSKLKELGYKTCLIIPNAHANGDREKRSISQTLQWAADRGLSNTDLIFTSLQDVPKYEAGVNPKVISDLFRLSNVFIFPTISENCSLVLLEAMMSGNLLILNKKVRSLMEFGGDEALYFDFDYLEPQDKNEQDYLDLAKITASEFENSRVLQAKRKIFNKFNFDYIFEHEIENLLYENRDK